MLRLWNMMTARCTFKRKVGLIEPEDEEQEESDGVDGEEGGEDQ